MNIRKIFIPVAAGFLISPAAFAAIVDDEGTGPSETFFYSDEYLSTATDENIVAGGLSVIIEAEYAVGDIVTWAVTGGAIDSGFPTSVTSACGDVGKPVDEAGITLGVLSSDADGAVYRVTEVDNGCGATTVGAQLDFGSLSLVATAVDSANTITAMFSAETGTGLALDTSGGADRSSDLVTTGSQYDLDVTDPFDGIIDVEDDRETFEFGTTWDQVDWDVDGFFIPTILGGADDANFASIGLESQAVTVTGPYAFIVDTDEVTDGVQPAPGVVNTSCTTTGETGTTISLTCNLGGQWMWIDNFPNLDGTAAVAIDDGSHSSAHEFTFDGIGGVENSITITSISFGAWALNGFSADIAYMPFGTGISQVIYLANRGPQAGAITVEWIDQNGASGSFGIGSIAAGSTKKIGQLIQDGLPAAQKSSGRLALTIIANVPSCDAQINSQYNVSGDRAFAVATTNCPVSAEFVGPF